MTHKLTQHRDIFSKDKHGIHLNVYDNIGDCGFVVIETEEGHNQEFYHKVSTFNYIILEGGGSFFLDDDEVPVEKGDFISIEPNTRIYYKGKMKLVLVTNPAWEEENEVETKPTIW